MKAEARKVRMAKIRRKEEKGRRERRGKEEKRQ